MSFSILNLLQRIENKRGREKLTLLDQLNERRPEDLVDFVAQNEKLPFGHLVHVFKLMDNEQTKFDAVFKQKPADTIQRCYRAAYNIFQENNAKDKSAEVCLGRLMVHWQTEHSEATKEVLEQIEKDKTATKRAHDDALKGLGIDDETLISRKRKTEKSPKKGSFNAAKRDCVSEENIQIASSASTAGGHSLATASSDSTADKDLTGTKQSDQQEKATADASPQRSAEGTTGPQMIDKKAEDTDDKQEFLEEISNEQEQTPNVRTDEQSPLNKLVIQFEQMQLAQRHLEQRIQKTEVANNDLKKEINDLKKEINDLKKENGDLKKEINDLKKENGDLKKENGDLKKKDEELKLANEMLEERIRKLEVANNELKKENSEQRRESGPLKKRVDVLEREVGKLYLRHYVDQIVYKEGTIENKKVSIRRSDDELKAENWTDEEVKQLNQLKTDLNSAVHHPAPIKSDDVVTVEKGECAIRLNEMAEGVHIVRQPCLCVYHEGECFKCKNMCPEYPGKE